MIEPTAILVETSDGIRCEVYTCARCKALVLGELFGAHSDWHDRWNGGR